MKVLCAGAGGFIGGHLTKSLLDEGHHVRAVDIKPKDDWYQVHEPAENWYGCDLSARQSALDATQGSDVVYCLAADMGGMGFIANHKADCMLTVLTSTHLLMAARDTDVRRFFYASSACVYPDYRQDTPDIPALKEADAYPAMPEDGYGWEKLFTERMCRHFSEDYGLDVRIARFHNVYGPHGTYDGGREKAPAAICRKVIEAKLTGNTEIAIWGDGEQTRSFMFVDDCVEGTKLILEGPSAEPVNLGSNELVTVNDLVTIVERIAGVKLERKYLLDAPQGVRGRNSDNTMIEAIYGWAPSITLEDGLRETYAWIEEEMCREDE